MTGKKREDSMEAIMEPDWKTVGILGAARGGALATDGAAIGTEHLLAAITTSKGAAREALADEGATQTALLAVIRGRMGRDDAWSGADGAGGSVGAQDVLGEDGDRRDRFTGAAAGALTAAMGQARREGAAKFGAVHLLRALLAEDNRAGDNRAVELLGVCGTSPQAVRDRLDSGSSDGSGSTGGAGGREDGLAPHLHATRDVLLGRAPYRHLPLWKRWLVKSAGNNLASKPAWWAGMETYEQARRLGDRAVGTEHVLLAVLATHEVALRYPHLAGENAPAPDTRYEGGERLVGLGIDYASVRDALTGDRVRLTTDARSVQWYLDEATSPGPGPGPEGSADSGGDSPVDPGTGPLVEILLRGETRARQIVEALTATSGA
ncbi:Clp protease N-terminal domain-containing protein [Streptomyces sp. NPDC000878]